MKRDFANQRGLAVLEAGGLFVLLLLMLLSAFGLVEYMRNSRALESTIDKYLFDSAQKPFAMKLGMNGIDIETNEQGLRQFTKTLAENIESEIRENLRQHNVEEGSSIYVETEYVVLDVNQLTGQVNSISRSPGGFTHPSSDPALQASLDSKVKLRDIFRKAAESEGIFDQNGLQLGKYASPSGLFTNTASPQRFMPSAVLVGVRAGIDFKDSVLNTLLNAVGMETFVYSYKVVNLRGEVE